MENAVLDQFGRALAEALPHLAAPGAGRDRGEYDVHVVGAASERAMREALAALSPTPGMVIPVLAQPGGLLHGPLMAAGRPCLDCLRDRNEQRRWLAGTFADHEFAPTGADLPQGPASNPFVVVAAAALTEIMIGRITSGTIRAGTMWITIFPPGSVQELLVEPTPQCRRCGLPGRLETAPT